MTSDPSGAMDPFTRPSLSLTPQTPLETIEVEVGQQVVDLGEAILFGTPPCKARLVFEAVVL